METPHVGIDDLSIYVPGLYLDLEDLAEARNLEYPKLRFGLGLAKMAVPDKHEDAATMAANAVLELIEKNDLDPRKIGRIYIGTESSLDGSKPIATYVAGMIEDRLESQFGPRSMRHCDVVDMTFACIGAIDAMQNTLDWAAAGTERIGIVVATDHAKYELESTGEYTQGAGAVAMLIKQDPRLISFETHWGVALESVHDFFKPLRPVSKLALIEAVLDASSAETEAGTLVQERLMQKAGSPLNEANPTVQIHSPMPVFDGPYSNQCYQDRVKEAYAHFKSLNDVKGEPLLDEWAGLIFHLPYAFHAKRMCVELFWEALDKKEQTQELLDAMEIEVPVESSFESEADYQKAKGLFLRAVGKTPAYKAYVKQKLSDASAASSEIGNMYTCSIFTALMSFLEAQVGSETEMESDKLGFFAYGSGAKSKVFEGRLQEGWESVASKFGLSEKLENRKRLSYEDYVSLHLEIRSESVQEPSLAYYLDQIGDSGFELGARFYRFAN